MAASFTAIESSSGLVITLTDTTNPVISGAIRSFVLTDFLGNALATLPLATGQTTTTYNITGPTWINVEFKNTGTSPFDITERFGFSQIYKNLYGDLLSQNSDCGCSGKGIDWCDVDSFDRGADYALPIGDAVRWQSFINAAYALLQS